MFRKWNNNNNNNSFQSFYSSFFGHELIDRFWMRDASNRLYGIEVSIIIKKYDLIVLNDELWY